MRRQLCSCVSPDLLGSYFMSKILASKDHENSKNQKSLTRLAILGGTIGLSVLAVILLLVVFR